MLIFNTVDQINISFLKENKFTKRHLLHLKQISIMEATVWYNIMPIIQLYWIHNIPLLKLMTLFYLVKSVFDKTDFQ